MAKSILVVDDEVKIVEAVKSYLESRMFVVYEAYNGKDALTQFDERSPSLVLLDLMLPDMSGEEVCNILRKKSNVPIILVTAKIREDDVLNGLHNGADGYITKPFSLRELVARAEAVLRRTPDAQTQTIAPMIYNGNDLMINTAKHEVKKKGKVVGLTISEYKLLMTLAKHPKKVFTRDELVYMVLGDDFSGNDRIIDAHIKNIRKKIETEPKTPKYIVTIHGIGYRFYSP